MSAEDMIQRFPDLKTEYLQMLTPRARRDLQRLARLE
jgi:hypothetical protein